MNENKKYYATPDLKIAYLNTSHVILSLSYGQSDDDNSFGEYIPIDRSKGNFNK